MRRISLWVGLSLAVAVLTGCPPTYPKCNNDEHCKEKGEFCVQGTCQECATDENCKEGFTCQANKCAPKPPECTTDTQCGAGRICEAGKCAEAQCKDDTQCPGGGKCQGGRCQAPKDACTTSTDCGEGQECQPESDDCPPPHTYAPRQRVRVMPSCAASTVSLGATRFASVLVRLSSASIASSSCSGSW